MISNLFLTIIILAVGLVFCLEDQLTHIPTARLYPEETYTLAVLNSTYTYVKPDGTSSLEDKSDFGRFAEHHVSENSGILIHVTTLDDGSDDPHTGCSLPFGSSYGTIPKNEKWIALVKKGKCNSQTKVQNAFDSNASGIIIYNDKPTSQLEKIRRAISVPKNFSVVFTYKWKGEELFELTDNGTTVHMHIAIGDVVTKSMAGNVNKTSVIFVTIAFVVLMMVSVGWIIFYYVQKCRYLHAKDRLSKRLSSAAKKALQKIPTRHIKADDKDVSNNTCVVNESCAICIELFKPADVVRLLPCGHEFHKLCIDPWLLEHRTCPMCKMDILKYFGFELTGSQESMLRIDQDDQFHDIFFFSPDSQNVSTIVETSTIVPITINHYPNIDMSNYPSTSQDAFAPNLSLHEQFTGSGDASLRFCRNSGKRLNLAATRRTDNTNAARNVFSPVSSNDDRNIGAVFITPNDTNLRRSYSFTGFQCVNADV